MTAYSASVEPPSAMRKQHRAILALSLAVIGLSLLLATPDDRHVCIAGFSSFPLPDVCQSRVWLKMDCPGCGLTRSFIHFFHGRFADSIRLHRVGWLLALLTALQIPYRLLALNTPNGLPLGRILPKAITFGVVALLAGNWVLKLAGV